MERFTVRNSEGIGVLKQPFECERCGDLQWSLPDLGNGSPIDKLAEYEDLEEQGKLLKLPCAVGDMVYHICAFKDGETEIIGMKVGCVEPFGAIRNHKGVCEIWNVYAETDYTKEYFKFFDFGKTVFFTREAAEVALKEL